MKKVLFLRLAILIATAGLFTIPAIAQQEKTIGIDKDGEFHIGSSIKVGGRTIEKGMYRMYHVFENTEHFIVIRKVAMGNYWRTMGPLELGDEVARLKCTIQPVDEQNKRSKLLLRRTAAGERVLLEVRFRREKVRHIFPV